MGTSTKTPPAPAPELNRARRALTPFALLALRVGVGVIMVVHGWGKLTHWDAWRDQVVALGIPAPNIMAGLAVAGELAGGAGLIVGLITSVAALGILGVMTVAIATVHAGNGLLAENNGFELPLTLGLVALLFLVRGGGRFSLDALLARRFQAWRRERRVQRGATAGAGATRVPA